MENENNKDRWNEISEDEKKALERGIADADAGKLNSHSKDREIYKKWL